MKRIVYILLYALMTGMLFGVIYIGVIGVLQSFPVGANMLCAKPLWKNVMLSQEKTIKEYSQKSIDSVQERLAYEKQIAKEIDVWIEQMTLEQKLAQMMILTNENDITAANLQRYQPGGVIFFEVDFKGKTIETVKNRVDTLQSYMKLPLLVGVDEEGGDVSRLKTLAEKDVPDFLGARELYAKGLAAVQEDTKEKMQYLKATGMNVNFAPVVDVVDNRSSYMYSRSASGDEQEVSEYAKTVLEVMQQEQVIGCMKHFPGYGNNVNTHNGLAKDNRSLQEYEEKDLVPFYTGIEAGVDMIMVSHIILEKVDAKKPASLSAKVHKLLRQDMGYQGVIVADDLNMQAILKDMTIAQATGEAFLAGNDMVFSADFAASMQGAKAAVEMGTLTEEQIEESLRRVLRLKIANGLLEIKQ